MELVRGIKITDYCDKNNLSTEERLTLFMLVCSAVQHAHQKGIIHRDIKPSNILVSLHDGVPVPKVIDFGIAKATTDQRLTDKTLFTAFEQFIGTPAYMSPEQAEMSGLDIDTRSDIYSLGVLLYELLTGKTPFDQKELIQAGLDAMRRTLVEKEPARPSTRLSTMIEEERAAVAKHRHTDALKLIHLLRGDLDWIVMKALEKDRTRRYETANGLAADIQRHLGNEPVVARPPSQLYRFGKLVRRNKLAFAFVAAVLVGLGVMVWLLGRTLNAERTQRQLEEEAGQARTAAAEKTAKETEARGQAILRKLLDESRATRLMARSAGWSQRAWKFASDAAKVQVSEVSSDVRDHAAAALAGLDARTTNYFTNFGASSVTFDPSGHCLLVGGMGDGPKLWDFRKGELQTTSQTNSGPVAFTVDGSPVHLHYGANRRSLVLSDIITSAAKQEWGIPEQVGSSEVTNLPLSTVVLASEGNSLAAVLALKDGNHAVVVFHMNTYRTLEVFSSAVTAMAISSDGSHVAVAESSGNVGVWRVSDGSRLDTFPSDRNAVRGLTLKRFNRTVGSRRSKHERGLAAGCWRFRRHRHTLGSPHQKGEGAFPRRPLRYLRDRVQSGRHNLGVGRAGAGKTVGRGDGTIAPGHPGRCLRGVHHGSELCT
jgi:hypothetical protein